MSAPMVIHIYGKDDEVMGTYTRSFIPWKILKKAVKLSSTLDPNKLTEENVEELAALVVASFGDQFTVDDLNDGADVGEMMAVLRQIVSRANGGVESPRTPLQEGGHEENPTVQA